MASEMQSKLSRPTDSSSKQHNSSSPNQFKIIYNESSKFTNLHRQRRNTQQIHLNRRNQLNQAQNEEIIQNQNETNQNSQFPSNQSPHRRIQSQPSESLLELEKESNSSQIDEQSHNLPSTQSRFTRFIIKWLNANKLLISHSQLNKYLIIGLLLVLSTFMISITLSHFNLSSSSISQLNLDGLWSSNKSSSLSLTNSTSLFDQFIEYIESDSYIKLRSNYLSIPDDEYLYTSEHETGSLPSRPLPQFLVTKYPLQLTYRPIVDCQHGRYLSANNMFKDGFGSVMYAHNAFLDLSIQLNLQQIQLLILTESNFHKDDNDINRNLLFKMNEYQISIDEIFSRCDPNDAINKNILRLNGTFYNSCSNCTNYVNETDPRKHGSQVENYRQQIENWKLENQLGSSSGYIIELNGFGFELFSNSYESSLIQQLRYYSQESSDNTYLMRSHIYPMDIQKLKSDIHISLHIRQGDILEHSKLYFSTWSWKMYHVNALKGLLMQIFAATDQDLIHRLFVTIYTQSNGGENLNELIHLMKFHQIRHRLHLNGSSTIAFQLMRESDIILCAKSAFSWIQILWNSHAIKLIDQDAIETGHFNDVSNSNKIFIANRTHFAENEHQTLVILEAKKFKKAIRQIAKEKDTIPMRHRELLFLKEYEKI